MSKFVVIKEGMSHSLIISDFNNWVDKEKEINEWMEKNLARGVDCRQGMIITFDTTLEMMSFLLKWA